jgi:CubicO group peptidase (beta-lactamase class C family)
MPSLLLALALAATPVADIDALMAPYAGAVPGASVLVVRDGQTVFEKAYGLADVEAGTPATPATNYRLASVTKQFTAAAILLLARDGVLSVDDPAKRWLPSLPAAADAVTLRHLLSHQSGLVDYEDVMDPGTTVALRDADVLRLLEDEDRTYFAPGTAYRYSNSGYAVLALVVGKASGKDFATFLRERIFVPLGMADTVAFEDGVSTVANRAYGYSQVDGGWQRTDQSMTSSVLGDGGVYASIRDLAKWNEALERTPFREAFVPQVATGEPDVAHYGFGWRLGPGTQWHSGETIGFRNVIVRWPAEKLAVVVLTNRNDPEPYRTALAIGARYQASRR